MIKLIVSDLDGTLLPYGESKIALSTKNLIYRWLSSGNSFAVSSGRTYGELLELLPEFEKDIYYIADDGAYYVRGGRLLYGRHIDREELCGFGREGGAARIFHGAFETYCVGEISDCARAHFSPTEITCRDINYGNLRIFKITEFSAPRALSPHSKIRLHWNDKEAVRAAQYVNRFCNKGASLSDLKLRLFLSGSEVAVLGDADNDIPMMRGAKYSFAVGDRSALAADAATHRVGSADEALTMLLNL